MKPTRTLFMLFLLLMTHHAAAQTSSSCSSDGQPTPTALFDRFINADCESCWRDPTTPVAAPGTLALDWIVPGTLGEDAPLAAATNRDALLRLEALNHTPPIRQSHVATAVTGWPGASLRVAHGVTVGDYIGASIELTLPTDATLGPPLQTWLVLVEMLPVNLENSPVARNLVRNVLQSTWDKHNMLPNSEHISFKEMRPMSLPQGVKPERLRVVGWVQDATGRVSMAAESVCRPENIDH